MIVTACKYINVIIRNSLPRFYPSHSDWKAFGSRMNTHIGCRFSYKSAIFNRFW